VNMNAAAKKFSFSPEPMPYGRVLVVDDVDANLYVAKGLLAFYGLDVETCKSGKEAVNKIRQGSTYDLVLMDHMMPGMNGLQTMLMMREMGFDGAVVALTASALIGQAEEFAKNGFDGFISKPIQTVHLNSILLKHVRDKQTAAVIEAAKAGASAESAKQPDINEYQNSSELVEKLRTYFAKSHKNACLDISTALIDGDTETAHRLAHTLKSSAALINEPVLSDIARQLEQLLQSEQHPGDNHLNELENELVRVIGCINAAQDIVISAGNDKTDITVVLNELLPLLESGNTDCLKLIGGLQDIPETAALVRQIEEFDFETAAKNVSTLLDIWTY